MSSDALPLLSIRGVGKTYAQPVLAEIDLQLFGGEVLALTGENGAGKSTLSKIVGGLERPGAGSLELLGRPYAPASRREAEAVGVRMVMQELNLLPTLSVAENLFQVEALRVRCADTAQAVGELSGGNQQKVVIGRWLERDCQVLLFDEPTRGIDVGAKFDIYALLAELTRRGKALVVVSSDLRELMLICDRIGVLSAGRMVDTFERDAWTQDALLAAAFAGYKKRDALLATS
ncbi:ribose ABC transporter ATPase [Pseudomonas aeruginosa VRFPA03]|nr:ribose ABC transporter ATPase [Pseudomonas aeruginosa VRFPA03]